MRQIFPIVRVWGNEEALFDVFVLRYHGLGGVWAGFVVTEKWSERLIFPRRKGLSVNFSGIR